MRGLKWLAILAALVLASVFPGAASARDAHPALWKASGRAGTVYLFGTIHALPSDLNWHTPALDRAEHEASALYLEVGNINDQAAALAAVKAYGMAPKLPPALDRVPASKRDALAALLAKYHLQADKLQPLKSWMIALTIDTLSLSDANIDPANGVDMGLSAEFMEAHKPVGGLESFREQFGFFNQLKPAAEEHFLEESISEAPTAGGTLNKIIAAWSAGDVAALAADTDKDELADPEVRRIIYHDRNARWTRWIRDRMSHPGVTLLAVGAGHLAGNDSVVAMLRRQGVRVRRVQ